MRLFLAVFPPEAVRAALYQAAVPLRERGAGVSWVSPANLHFTMRFLGELGEDGARRAGEAALEAAAGTPAFEAVPGAYGAFPSAHRARVIWVGLERGGEALVALARALDRALERRGFDRPDRAFTAHLTLGRVREREADWSAALAAAPKRDPVGLEFRVARLSVVESTLSPRGSIYRVRLEAPLTS